MKIGYARVSSAGQNLETQIEKLTTEGCNKIFQEKKSGGKDTKREMLEQALEFCRDGDILVVTKLDRLARSMFHLQSIVNTLERKNVGFIVIDQKIDNTTPTGRLTFQLLGAIAEFERELINERRNEGCENAKKRGVKFGQKPKLSKDQVESLKTSYIKGVSKETLMKDYMISRSVFYRYLGNV